MPQFSTNIVMSFRNTIVAMDPILPVATKTNGKSKLSSTFIIIISIAFHVHEVGNIWTVEYACKRVEYPDIEKIVMTH